MQTPNLQSNLRQCIVNSRKKLSVFMTAPRKDPKDESDLSPTNVPNYGERPFECIGSCRKPIAVWYTEMVGYKTIETCMCKDCPELERRLKGIMPTEGTLSSAIEEGGGFCCGVCGTRLGDVRTGHTLGCAQCYEAFGDLIYQELWSTHKLFSKQKEAALVHVGHKPGQSLPLSPSLQLIALNEALKETLKKEDYEQAAWLRDQIKELTEENDHERE